MRRTAIAGIPRLQRPTKENQKDAASHQTIAPVGNASQSAK
ncbi:hypothetical protein SLCC85_150174 [Listeria monocytogenes]|nr:hypothetical protein SLCC85_150174 [Listeria monocytogenes]